MPLTSFYIFLFIDHLLTLRHCFYYLKNLNKQKNSKIKKYQNETMKQEASPPHTQKTHFVLVSYSRALDLFWRWLIDAARFHWRKLIFSSQQVSVANSSLARGKTLCTFLLRAEMKILFYSNRRITRILYFLGFFFF